MNHREMTPLGSALQAGHGSLYGCAHLPGMFQKEVTGVSAAVCGRQGWKEIYGEPSERRAKFWAIGSVP